MLCSLRRRGRFVTLIAMGLVAMIGASFYLLMSVESDNNERSHLLDVAHPVEPVKALEESVQKLEAGIQKMNEFHNNLKNMNFQPDAVRVPQLDKVPQQNYEQQIDEPKVLGQPRMPSSCPNYSYKPVAPHADIQMDDEYQKVSFKDVDGGVWKQGFDIHYNTQDWSSEKPLKVFVVPHSHNDPGWLKTYPQYYKDQVRPILNNMVTKLSTNPTWKFMYAEMSFFSIWWSEIDEKRKQEVKRLMKSGQFEVVTGGWVMNDEANTHYTAMIDQMVTGNLWMKDNLGASPKSGWAIDPFGHTSTMAYLLQSAGLENMLIQRVHYSVKKHLAKKKNLEFMWRPIWENSKQRDILCHMMPFYSYDVPHTCGPDPKVCCQFDFLRKAGGKVSCPWRVPPQVITGSNVRDRALLLLDQYRKKAQLYRSNVVLAPLGDDFRFDTLAEWDAQYSNYQKLFDYLNTQSDLNVQAQFGTLSDYFDAVREDLGDVEKALPSLSGDFFTYADRQDHYWSGYYTSRAFYKNFDRQLESAIRSAEVILALARFNLRLDSADVESSLDLLNSAHQQLGLFQHHDGITGTAKSHVVTDYGNRLWEGLNNAQHVIGWSASKLLFGETSTHLLQMTEKKTAEDSLVLDLVLDTIKDQTLVVFNSLTHNRSEVVSVTTNSPRVAVFDRKNKPVTCQVSPHLEGTGFKVASTQFQVSFVADVPSLTTLHYKLTKAGTGAGGGHECVLSKVTLLNHKSSGRSEFDIQESGAQETSIAFQDISVMLDTSTGTMKSYRQGAEVHPTSVSFVSYGTVSSKDKSGAYLFMPNGDAKPLRTTNPPIYMMEGPVVKEIASQLKMVIHRMQISNTALGQSGVLIHNLMDIRDAANFELAMRVTSTGIDSGHTFYTDLNGLHPVRRQRREDLPLQANVYPMTGLSYVQDKEKRLSVLTTQSAGLSSPESGCLEVMMDRRLNQDDNRGLGQGVLDNKLTPASYVIKHETAQTTAEVLPEGLSYPSLDTSAHLSSLIHHLVVMRTTEVPSTEAFSAGVDLASPSLPISLELVSVRNLRKPEGHTPATLAATVRGIGFDPAYPSHVGHCPGNQIHISQLFSRTKSGVVREVSLTTLHTISDSVSSEQSVTIEPMAIKTFELEASHAVGRV